MVLVGAVSTLVIASLMAVTLGVLLITGRVWRRTRPPRRRIPRRPGPAADDALRRHPAGRARHGVPEGLGYPPTVMGPDDDPEFINSLGWLIRGDDPDAGP
jgi:hypothetical protein